MDLAAVLDVHAASFTHVVHTLGARRVIRTAHGLGIVPRAERAQVERVLVPTGRTPPDASALDPASLTLLPNDRAPFRAAVEDLAAHAGTSVAAFAARRLELRTPWRRPRGAPMPVRLLLVPLTAVLSVLIAARALGRRRSRPEDVGRPASC